MNVKSGKNIDVKTVNKRIQFKNAIYLFLMNVEYDSTLISETQIHETELLRKFEK